MLVWFNKQLIRISRPTAKPYTFLITISADFYILFYSSADCADQYSKDSITRECGIQNTIYEAAVNSDGGIWFKRLGHILIIWVFMANNRYIPNKD